MIDVEKLYPGARKVNPESVIRGTRVALAEEDGGVESLCVFEVREQSVYEKTFTAPDGGRYHYYDGVEAYVLPPELPVEVGSMVRNVKLAGWTEPFLSGTLLPDGRWALVTDGGMVTSVGADSITGFRQS